MPAASYAGITTSNNNPTVNTTQNTNISQNSQILSQPTGNNFEQMEKDRNRTISLETKEGEITTEKLHVYFQL